MPRAKISQLGAIGVNGDLPPQSIPDNAFTRFKNARAYHGRVTNFPGYTVYAQAPIQVYGLFGFETATAGTLLWVECGLNQVYVYNGATHSNITRSSGNYTTNEYFDRWSGGAQSGIGFLCNAIDSPQQWDKIDEGTQLKDMFWDPAATAGSQTWGELNYRTFAMRSYGGAIFALGMQKGGDVQQATVAWSDFVKPNDPNIEFQPKSTNSAGDKSIGDTLGACIDAAPLRDDLIIYKEDSVWRCSLVNDANEPFRFARLPEYVRILNRACIGVAREFHVVAAAEDVYIFDGNVFRSLLQQQDRDFYRANLWGERRLTTHVGVLPQEQEVWICITSPGSTGEAKWPDQAIVWNYRTNTFQRTELPSVRSFDIGPITQTGTPGQTYADLTFAYRDWTTPYGSGAIGAGDTWLVGAHGQNISVFGIDPTDNGTPRECIAERTGLVLMDADTGVRSSGKVNRVQTIRPYMETTGPVNIQVGSQMTADGQVKWQPVKTFDPTQQNKLNFRSSGKYMAYRILTQENVRWALTELEIDYTEQRQERR